MASRGERETIAAVATAPGAGGIAVVRLSGPDAIAIAQAMIGKPLPERRVVLGRARGRAEVEATIDFPDEGLALPAAAALAARCRAIADACAALAATYRAGRAVQGGVVVALAGPVNAGKSSLFNAMLGRERSIVSDAP